MTTATLLVELFTEELPPKALKQLGDAFADQVLNGLIKAQLTLRESSGVKSFATPRRLAVLIPDVMAKAPDRKESKKLMPSSVAIGGDGKPAAALLKRLEKEGASAEQIEKRVEGGIEYVFLDQTVNGATLTAGLQATLNDALTKLPIPKVMSYQLADGETTVQFVRPAHGLVALHGDKIIPVSVLGLKADRIVHGHRFQGMSEIVLKHADEYEVRLEKEGGVIAGFDARWSEIERQLQKKAGEVRLSMGNDIIPLLDELAGLVECPTVYVGEFEKEFLDVPQECLILTMKQNQKYFPLFDGEGKLSNKFLIVSNMRLEDPHNIVEGNQRVVRPRLADARFFFKTDKKTKLAARVPKLSNVVYHNKLGSQGDRVARLVRIAGSVSRMFAACVAPYKTDSAGQLLFVGLAERAASLAKADLITEMVGEFPELQGIMGSYYAVLDGEDPLVARAIEEHYKPRFAGDNLPSGDVSTVLALADKMETLAGLFGIGQQPTGDKDPFALRRHALGVIRILIDGMLPIELNKLVNVAFAGFPHGVLHDVQTDLETFIFERLRGYLREEGYTANEVEAVLCMRPVRLDLVPRQLAAVRAFAALPEAESLAAANKRVANILKQAESKGESFINADASALQEKAEHELFEALSQASKRATPLFQQGNYTEYLKTFAVLKSPVDSFFDSVMVMVDSAPLRRNRLALLADLRREMNRVADISKLAA